MQRIIFLEAQSRPLSCDNEKILMSVHDCISLEYNYVIFHAASFNSEYDENEYHSKGTIDVKHYLNKL